MLLRCCLATLLLLIGLASSFGASAAQSAELATDHLRSRLVAASSGVKPGQSLWIGLRLEHDRGWHTYWKNPGDSGLPTRLQFELPQGVGAGPIAWPLPERQPAGELTNFGYSHTELLPVEVSVPADFPGDTLPLRLSASWLICDQECIPGSGDYALELPVIRDDSLPGLSAWTEDFSRATRRQPQRLADANAQYSVSARQVDIRLTLNESIAAALGSNPSSWTLIPATAQILANADTPRLRVDTGELHAAVARSEFFAGTPESIELLLSNGELGFEFEARLQQTALASSPASSAQGPAQGPADIGLLLTLLMAFAGGLVLNLMPCVFPVLSLKALGAIEAAERPAELRRHGLWYALGVISSVLAVAILLLLLRAGGQALGWGFQLQQPGFVAAIALLLFAMGLSFSGLHEFGAGAAGIGQRLTEGGGRRGAFFTGVLACVVASPCSAPFMGTALGIAVMLPAYQALLVFAALGLGLAFPMLALGYLPAMARALPRPGAWMQTFRELLAFPLYLTVLWLAWVFARQTSLLALIGLGTACVVVAFAMWLLRQAEQATNRGAWLKTTAAACIVAALLLPIAASELAPAESAAGSGADSAEQHEPYSAARLASLREQATPVLVNMTADWCITCLANERVALSSRAVTDAMRRRGVVYLKGDWTLQDADITAYLESFGRSGVPLYVLYPPGGEPVVLPQLLTPQTVINALEPVPPAQGG